MQVLHCRCCRHAGVQRHAEFGEFLPQMLVDPGDPKVAAFCSSEPNAGSDVGVVPD